MRDEIVTGRYLLQCLSEVPEGEPLPAGVELDSQGKYRIDGERVDPTAEYRVWNCANPNRVFSADSHMSDWSAGPATGSDGATDERSNAYEIVGLDGTDDFLGGSPASSAWFATLSAAEASAQELAEEYPGSRFAIRNAAGQTVAEVLPNN